MRKLLSLWKDLGLAALVVSAGVLGLERLTGIDYEPFTWKAFAQAYEEICRTPGFWGSHADRDSDKRCSQNITGMVLDLGGGLTICGESITTTGVEDAASAVEAICVRARSGPTRQLVRQLTTLGLNCIVSSGSNACAMLSVADLFADCNKACVGDPTATRSVGECIAEIDCFNNGRTFEASTGICRAGTGTSCLDRDLPLASMPDLPNNDETTAGRCFGAQGASGSSDECSEARTSDCGVTEPQEDDCDCDTEEGGCP